MSRVMGDYLEDDVATDIEQSAALSQRRGVMTRADGRICIGRVGAPADKEATAEQFYFWFPEAALVEKTQIVTCESEIAGQPFTFYALVDEVRRQSRKRSMSDEQGEADGDLTYEPPFASEGFTYASASILKTEPPVLIPPRERSDVLLAGEAEAGIAYGADEMERPLKIGLIKNGGDKVTGAGQLDLDYLLGANGGHMNVNGVSGRGTKSSFLLHLNYLLIREAQKQKQLRPSDPNRLRVVPIILNVKNFDLFYIDCRSNRFNEEKHLADWQALGITDPAPFADVSFYAAQQPGNSLPVPTGRTPDVQTFSWSLSDVIEQGLFAYLFAETDATDANFGALVLDIENWLTDEKINNDGSVSRLLRHHENVPKTFQEFLKWVDAEANDKDESRTVHNHHTATWKKLHRRLLKIVYESKGVLRRDELHGKPLNLVRGETSNPLVVDLAALASQGELQRFVVATILRQLVEARTGTNAISGLVYLVTLDELNRFAPRGARDPITRLIEMVAAEMRSRGIILLGAQQQASKVSEKVIESCAIQALGKSGAIELESSTWKFLSKSAKTKAASLPLNEKLVLQDNFREPMHLRVPMPAWAMNLREATGKIAQDDDNFSDIIDE